jgi:ABC-2 type transport system permease protein
MGQVPSGSRLLFVPLSFAVLLVWAFALALVLSAVNVYLRDVQYLVEIVLMVMFWMSPIVYSWEYVAREIGPVLEQVYLANPVTAAVLGLQEGLWVAGTDAPRPEDLGTRLVVMLALGVAAMWAGQRVFSRLESDFAQEL